MIGQKAGHCLLCAGLAVLLFLGGCASRPHGDLRFRHSLAKDIFIFIDGTTNDANSNTNPRILYELITYQSELPGNDKKNKCDNELKPKEDCPAKVAFYVEGVGDARHPLLGAPFGKGGSSRVEVAYARLMQTYVPGDRIYIFGFSRGAVYARALAGLVSYAGLPKLASTPKTPEQYDQLSQSIHDYAKEINDDDFTDWWANWQPGKDPPIAGALTATTLKDLESQGVSKFEPVEITMLGVWDSVPGSLFIKYPKTNCVQRDSEDGTKFKTNTYPTIRRIYHAISADEKRDRFQVLRLCKPLNQNPALGQIVEERVFPGAHSDVGGGYEDSDRKLSSLSLKWMLDKLSESGYKVPQVALEKLGAYLNHPDAATAGIAHWSRSGVKNLLVTDCKDRKLFKAEKWEHIVVATRDPSMDAREKQGFGLIKPGENKEPVKARYPITCDQYEAGSHLD